MTTQCVVRAAERPSAAARELAPPARKLVFYKRNTAALFFCFTRIAIIYPLFCCGGGHRSRLSPRSVLLLRRGVHRTPAPLPYNLQINCFGIRKPSLGGRGTTTRRVVFPTAGRNIILRQRRKYRFRLRSENDVALRQMMLCFA